MVAGPQILDGQRGIRESYKIVTTTLTEILEIKFACLFIPSNRSNEEFKLVKNGYGRTNGSIIVRILKNKFHKTSLEARIQV
jgi:hypothetical protein